MTRSTHASPWEFNILGAAVAASNPSVDPSSVRPGRESGFFEAALAAGQLENVTRSLLVEGGLIDRWSNTERDPTFNQYTYAEETLDPEELKRFEPLIRAGVLEKARSPEAVDTILAGLRDEKRLRDVVSGGPVAAEIVGGIVGSVLDLPSLIPGFAAARSLRLGRAALQGAVRVGGAAGAVTAGSEAILHQSQELRTAEETFWNIGGSIVLGGGLGAFLGAVTPLRVATVRQNLERAQSVIVRDHRGVDGEEVITPSDEVLRSRPVIDAAGAERTAGIEFEQGFFQKIPLLNKLTRLASRATPVGRVATMVNQKAAAIGMKLADIGGILTKAAKGGIGDSISAEDLMNDKLIPTIEHTFRMSLSYIKLQRTIAQQGATAKLSEDDFIEVYRKTLFERDGETLWGDDDFAELASRFGEEPAKTIVAAATDMAERAHKINSVLEEDAIARGLLRDEAEVRRLTVEIDRLLKERTALADGGETGVSRADIDREIEALSVERERQLNLPKPLGREFGMAQIWDASTIDAYRTIFTRELREILAAEPTEEWLLETYNMTPDELRGLSADSPERQRILEDWAGEEYEYRLAQAEDNLEAALQAEKVTKADFLELMRETLGAQAELRDLNVQRARKFRDALHARLEASRAQREDAVVLAKAFKDAAEAARNRTLARQQQFIDDADDVGAAELARFEAAMDSLDRAEEAYRKFWQNEQFDGVEVRHGREKIHEEVDAFDFLKMERRGRRLERAQARADDARDAAFEAPLEAPKAPAETVNKRIAELEGRADAYADILRRSERNIEKLEDARMRTEDALRAVEARVEDVRARRAEVQAERVEARKFRDEARKEARAAERDLKKIRRQTPLDELISGIVDDLAKGGVLRHGSLDAFDEVTAEIKTGRFKHRRIRLTPEQRKRLENVDVNGQRISFLRGTGSDALRVQLHGWRQIAGNIALNEALDIGPTGSFKSWTEVVDDVNRSYDEQIASIGEGSSEARALNTERKAFLKDMVAFRQRLLGTTDPGMDRDGWAFWISQKMRDVNFLRYGPGFLVSSLTDVGTVALQHGSLAKILTEHGASTARLMKNMHETGELPDSEVLLMVAIQELGAHGLAMNRAMMFGDAGDDMSTVFGFGPAGSRQRRFSSAIDQGMNYAKEKAAWLSGINTWNRYLKITSGLARVYKLRDMTTGYGNLSAVQRAELATLTIGEAEAARIAKYIHLGEEVDGIWDPRLDRWVTEGGQDGLKAARDFRIALARDMKRSVITPGIGDTPILLDKAWAKMFLQFQTFAFTFVNKVMIPASQRFATFGTQDARLLSAFANMMWSSTLVVVLKDLLQGRDPVERFSPENWPETALDVFDRSGFMAYATPYVNGILKLTAPIQEEVLGQALVPTTRMSQRAWSEAMLGVNFSLFRDVSTLGAAAFAGDGEAAVEKGMRLLPAQVLWRVLRVLHTDDSP